MFLKEKSCSFANKRIIIIVNSAVLAVMAAFHLWLVFVPNVLLNMYFSVCRPVVYTSIVIILFMMLGGSEKKPREYAIAPLVMGIAAIVYITSLFLIGFLFCFAKNAMFTNLKGFTQNLWVYVPFVCLSEIIRVRLLKNVPARAKVFMMVLILFVYTFVQVENLNSFIASDLVGRVDYIISSVLPLFVLNGMLIYVALSGSIAACVILRGVYVFVPVFVPILPNVTKITESIILYATIFVAFLMYDKIRFDLTNRRSRERYNWKALLVPALLIFIAIFSGIGLTSWVPVAVASESMTGTFDKGSIVLVAKIPAAEVRDRVKVGDVIQFSEDNAMVLHRVIDITSDSYGETLYVMKGDGNMKPDRQLIRGSQVVGVAKGQIPYIGYPAIILSRLMSKMQ